jgi:hypothetical protein
MSGDGYDHSASRYRAMVFDGPEAMATARQKVTAAMDATFGVRRYTTSEGWLVGGREGNGDVNQEGPQASPAWRMRIEKARRDIAEHKIECRLRVLAIAITTEQILNDIEEIRSWANSLNKVQLEHGWKRSMLPETN